MKVTRKSMISGKEHTKEIPITEAQYEEGMELWQRGLYIQDAFPELSSEDREFIKTGITPEEWDEAMGEDAWE